MGFFFPLPPRRGGAANKLEHLACSYSLRMRHKQQFCNTQSNKTLVS
jgi:hypothetical protein